MTTPSSGYVMINVSEHYRKLNAQRDIPVPNASFTMISVYTNYARSAACPGLQLYEQDSNELKTMIWGECEHIYVTAQLYKTKKIIIYIAQSQCIWFMTQCFKKIKFSFHPESQTPRQLPSGLFNCSVEYYSSFQQHLDCNMRAECEDGRDEREHCLFSDSDCQGLVAASNHCYKFVSSMALSTSDVSDTFVHRTAGKYCGSLGGVLGTFPCKNRLALIKTFLHFERVLLGLYFHDEVLPNIYRRSIVSEDKSVFHHKTEIVLVHLLGSRSLGCGVSESNLKTIDFRPCKTIGKEFAGIGFNFVCQFKKHINNHRNHSYDNHPNPMKLPNISLSTNGFMHLTKCQEGDVTHKFLACGPQSTCVEAQTFCNFSAHLPHLNNSHDSIQSDVAVVPMFTCNDGVITLSYTLVCDIRYDCRDKTDESFCKHSPCVNMFTCTNGQCVSYDNLCDILSHCIDNSEEQGCHLYRIHVNHRVIFQIKSPILINFDGLCSFTGVKMKANKSCPDTHYRCPGGCNDCLPVYTRCNGMYDCLGHEDEEGCEEMKCPGFFHCRSSQICVHGDHLCDGWPHCPLHDDELLCDMICPLSCLCHGNSFRCVQPFSAHLFPQLRLLDATGSGMTLSDLGHNTYLIHLVLAHCSLGLVSEVNLYNLQFLDFSQNKLQYINISIFVGLENIQTLSLAENPLSFLQSYSASVIQQRSLRSLDLSHTKLSVFGSKVLSKFLFLQTLNLSFSTVHTINTEGFHFTPQLIELYMEGNPVKTFPPDMFTSLSFLRTVSAQNYKLCCSEILPGHSDRILCYAPQNEISSCKDLLRSEIYSVFLWLISCLSLTGNVFCFVARMCLSKKSSSSGFGVFVTNLTVADFLMGVYIAVIGVANERFRGKYLHYEDVWRNSVACKLAGFISLLSSEVSALIIWLITLDRFVALRFPFSTLRFEKTSASMACLLTWVVGWSLALVPLLPVISHWLFYSQTGICIPLPVTTQYFKGKYYSFSILIAFNFVLFVLISGGQSFIYSSIQQNALAANTTKISQDLTIARRLITVAVTDFMCWFPIGLCGLLAIGGISITGEINVALAIFVLPLNSALNPFMYTFNTFVEKRRKSKEAKLLKWLELHIEQY